MLRLFAPWVQDLLPAVEVGSEPPQVSGDAHLRIKNDGDESENASLRRSAEENEH